MRPPWASTIRRQVARPIPLPSCSPPPRGHRHVRCVTGVKLEGVGDEVLKDPEQSGAAGLQRWKCADIDAPVEAFHLRPEPNGNTVCTQTPRTWIASR
jgi:hypothetical protein